ncbi:MAG: hypothetical protein AB1598_02535 [Thermodesulfobacteriota bacterium]
MLAPVSILLGTHHSHAQEQKYHPLESYMVKYKVEGNSTGEKTEYSGEWGRTLCWTETTEVKIPDGDPFRINEKVITRITGGEQWIIKIDLDKNTGTKVKNPMFPEIYKRIKGKDPAEFTKEFMANTGAKPGVEKTVGGEKCREWDIGEGARTCLTGDLVRVESSLVLEKLSVKETAVDVKRNVPEPADICGTGGAVITETAIQEKPGGEIKVE